MRLRLILLLITFLSFSQAKDNLNSYQKAYENYLENKNNFDSIYNLALSSLKMKQPIQAMQLVKKLLKQRPNYPTALLLYAEIYIALNRYEEAGIRLAKILELYPNSDYTKKVYEIIDLIKRKKSNFTSAYIFSFKAGFDTNPALFNQNNDELIDYGLRDIGSANLNLDNIPQKGDAFSELTGAGNYIHDFGKRGSWFATYNWNANAKTFASSEAQDMLNVFHIKSGAAIGYATNKSGQITLENNIGVLSSGVNEKDNIGGHRYAMFSTALTYNYKMFDNTIFTLSLSHSDLSSFDKIEFINTYIDETNTTVTESHFESSLRHGFEELFIQFNGNVFTNDRFKLKCFVRQFYTDDRREFLPDPTVTFFDYHIPYSHYMDYGINISYDYSYNARLNFLIDLYHSTRVFEHHYLTSQPISEPYDYQLDPSNILRKDEYGKLTLTARFKNSERFVSALSYAISENKTNFTPAAYSRHEFVFTLYWMP